MFYEASILEQSLDRRYQPYQQKVTLHQLLINVHVLHTLVMEHGVAAGTNDICRLM